LILKLDIERAILVIIYRTSGCSSAQAALSALFRVYLQRLEEAALIILEGSGFAVVHMASDLVL
jgi:hypothetical protein